MTGSHDVSEFDCGIETLNAWLHESALQATERGTARTFVWTDQGSVVAYYSITATEVRRSDLTSRLAGGITISPAFLLARLALDKRLHNQGHGGDLLNDALDRMVDAATSVGARLIVVDAINDEAAAFYRHYNFVAVEGRPQRLYIKLATVRGTC